MATVIRYAHYYGSKTKGYTVRINESVRPVGGMIEVVTGKRQARAVAILARAKPYNF